MTNYKPLLAIGAAGLLMTGGVALAISGKPSPFQTPGDRVVAAAPRPAPVVIPQGTVLRVRLNETVGTRTSDAGDRFGATLESPIIVDGRTVAPRGAQVTGVVRDAAPSGRLKGRARLMLALNSLEANGRQISIRTTSPSFQSGGHKKRNWAWLGGGAGTGALIGGLAGGPAGAGIGAGAGGAAGLTGALISGKQQLRLPAETLVTFRLESPATVQF